MNFKLELDNSKENLHDVLGISTERQDQIKDIIVKAWKEETLVTSTMDRIAQQCNTLNELAIGMMGLGQLMNALRKQPED